VVAREVAITKNMNRVIRFRARRKDNNEWEYGSLVVREQDFQWSPGYFISVFGGEWVPVIPETVGQFIGLVDKNDRDIYEGHIVKVLERGVWYPAEVAYASCGFFLKPLPPNPHYGRLHFTESTNGSGKDDGVEVIGSIHRIPEKDPDVSERDGSSFQEQQ
jgi:hypothetical protein